MQSNKQLLDEMLRWSNGAREVPVVVEDGKVLSIGWGGMA